MKMLALITLVFLLFASISEFAYSQESQLPKFSPAGFGTGPESLTANLECPEQLPKEGVFAAFCQALISSAGSAKGPESYCFPSEPGHLYISRHTREAMQKSRFVPARVNGRPVRVVLSYRVVYLNEGSECRAIPLANLGYQTTNFGHAYFAPQEILEDLSWLTRARILDQPRRLIGHIRSGVMFHISVLVSTEGEAGDAQLEKNFFALGDETKKSLRALAKSRFIPGFYNGKATEMRYHEILYIAPPQ